MRLKNRKNKIFTVATFIIAIILANLLQTCTDNNRVDVKKEFNYTKSFLDSPIPPENNIELEVSFSDLVVEDVSYPNEDAYTRISIEDCGYMTQVGRPRLPFRTLKILLPYGKDLDKVNIIPSERYTLDGKFKIEPAHAQICRGSDELPKVVLDGSIYQSGDLFPENIYSEEGVYELKGYRILVLNIFPVQYIPNTGEILYFKDMKVQVSVSDDAHTISLLRDFNVDEEHVMNIVDNPEIINTYRGNKDYGQNIRTSSGLPSGSYDYVIITNEALKNSAGAYTFQDLANYKNTHGFQTTIITVEYIYANYPGGDNQEKIRNFIIDAYQTWGIKYVLLGGDSDGANLGGESEDPIVPARGFYARVDDYYGTTTDSNIPSDLYYAALDGTWDDDGDGLYGEPGEEDLYAEVYVGRAPVDSEEELSNFIRKTLAHEEINDPYLSKALMVGEYMGYYSGFGKYRKEAVRWGWPVGKYKQVGFQESDFIVDTLYDYDLDPGRWDKNDLIPLINDGVHIINHIGDSGFDHNMKLNYDDVDSLSNNKYFFGYSQDDYVGGFDNLNYYEHDSIGEHFLTAEHGAFAFIAYSRRGWGIDYYIDFGPTLYYDQEFFDAILGEGIQEIGRANQDSKEDNIGYFPIDAMRWCYYTINLFGDPTTSITKRFEPNLVEPIHIDQYGAGDYTWETAKLQDWCSGSGIKEDPYLIKDVIINDDGSGTGITIENSVAYFRIENCEVHNSGIGIRLITTRNGEIINNDCSDNNLVGIELRQSNRNNISGNTAVNNLGLGIDLRSSNENNLIKNVIRNSGIGIRLIVDSSENNVAENTLSDNNYAIMMMGAPSDNVFYLNLFYRSFDHHTRYFGYSGSGNSWDNGSVGNYWDDYTGIDYDDNRIGDTPYYTWNILEIDNYPIWDDGPYGGSIFINDNADNNWQDATSRYWCSGSGTEDDPYVIKDLIIDGGGSLFGSCIMIKNSNVYFRIENCTVYKSGFGGYDAGIRLINTQNGELINNDVSQNNYGIWLRNSNENILRKNILSESLWSLIIQNSNENNVTENTFSDNIASILMVGSSSDNLFYSNLFYRSTYSHVGCIDLSYSGSGNTWDNGSLGNYWDDYTGVDEYGDDSIGDTPYIKNDVIDNYPLWEDGPVYIDELGGGDYTWEEASTQFWCSGSGTEDDPYVIKNLIIDCGGTGSGIIIENSNAYFRIENCKVYNSGIGDEYNEIYDAGIKLSNTDNGEIINNDCLYNHIGIHLFSDCDNNIISGNTLNYNSWNGILLYYDCDNNIISGNVANNNSYGIELLVTCDENIISGNTANFNLGDGYYGGHGIYLYECYWYNTISGNTANNNDGSGIYLYDCRRIEISENKASYNERYGIFLEWSIDNYGRENYLHSNGEGPIYFDYASGPTDWIEYTEF